VSKQIVKLAKQLSWKHTFEIGEKVVVDKL
jgi:hypothetical protein